MLLSITFVSLLLLFFFFNDTATTEIYTLSLHDALPILEWSRSGIRAEPASTPAQISRDFMHRERLRSEEHTSELQSHSDLVCRLLLEKKKKKHKNRINETKKN